jgi:hypothetical protein
MMKKTSTSEQTLSHQLAQLPKEISPERDLWSGIERAINHTEQLPLNNVQTKKTTRFNTPLAWAASVVIAVLFSWQLNTYAPQKKLAQLSPAQLIQQNFQQQKQLLLASFGQKNSSNLSFAMQNELQQLKSAQSTIYKALMQDKNNQDLLNLLQWTQQQELKLLEQLYQPQWQSI